MELKEYKIQKGDTLESIAAKHQISVKELLNFHNQYSGITQAIYSTKIPFHIKTVLIDPDLFILSENTDHSSINNIRINKNYMYRTEMTVGTILEGIMVDNSTYKSQYRVGLSNNNLQSSVVLEESHVTSSPKALQAGMELLAEVDEIKCNSIFKVNSQTGKIENIINYKEIISNWDKFKNGLSSRNTILKLSQNQKDIVDFVKGVEALIKPENNLIQDYYSKMFYEVFFTEHLVGEKDFTRSYYKAFYSTLFNNEEITLNFTASLIEENDDVLKVRRVSELDASNLNMNKIVALYDERYKPMVKYNFSEYNYSYRETLIWNKKDDILQESHITVIEEVKNNIQLLIDFKLKKVE